jgi:hypothetical protein
METLTKEQFDKIPLGEVFATGVLPNSPAGIFMTRDGGELRWVAKKGWGYDWAVYCHWSDKTPEWIRDHGDKIYDETYIRRCVPCDDDVYKIYRR